jgi:predicted metalloprotease
MRFNRNARLDTSQVEDARRSTGMLPGGAGGRIAMGGGGVGAIAVVVLLLVNALGGGSGSSALNQVLGQLPSGSTADNTQVAAECQTGEDANNRRDCAVVADIDSIQAFWDQELPRFGTQYVPATTIWFSGQVNTGCGTADRGAGPFYCPADDHVYIDLTFYDDLQAEFGANGSNPFVDAYVLAHEYGHHVQDLLGTGSKVTPGDTGPESGSVRLELQADCYAGVWANHASTVPDATGVPLVTDITEDDIAQALDTAARIGDDFIQTHLGNGQVDQSEFTHGTSAQRQKWLSTGLQTGDPAACDTFAAGDLG